MRNQIDQGVISPRHKENSPRKRIVPGVVPVLLSAWLAACSPGAQGENKIQQAPTIQSGVPTQGIPTPTLPPTPTETPTPTKTPEPTPTPESVKKIENPLPEYSVFSGELRVEGDENQKGSIIVSHLPRYQNFVHVFAVKNREINNFILELVDATENSLETVKPKMMLTLKDGQLSGKWQRTSKETYLLTTRYYGKGREAYIEALKKLWAKEIVYDPALWPRVPEKTVLGFNVDVCTIQNTRCIREDILAELIKEK